MYYISKKHGVEEKLGIPSLVISVLIVFTAIIINSYIPFETDATPYAFIYSAICSLLVVSIQLGLFEMSSLKREAEIIKHLDAERWKQHELFRDSIEQINIKSHDLKQQINYLLSSSKESRKTELQEAISMIEVYDSMVQTGNDTLDVVLTEKKLICERNGIKCACIVEGSALNFMNSMDIASLFGNIMDNAIEGVKKLDDADNGFINLNVSHQSDILIIHAENNYNGELKFNGELPKTTKKDNSNHGFGMKSIKSIVEKYDGHLSILAEDGLFSINILFTR